MGDSVSYDDLASRFSQGKGYTRSTASDEPDSRRLPGYPFFLAAIYFTFGHSLFAVRLIQVILDALTCVIVYKLSKEVLDDAGQALWSALLAVTYLPFILFANFILSETLYVAIVTIAIFFPKPVSFCRTIWPSFHYFQINSSYYPENRVSSVPYAAYLKTCQF